MTEYKGILHIHSTHSYDGKMSLAELKHFLMDREVSFACMTEHTDYLDKDSADRFVRECQKLSDEQFIFIPGFEVPYQKAHLLHIDTTEFICDFANAEELFKWRAVSPLVILAHPVRNDFVADETMLNCIDGVEVWNQQYEGKRQPRNRNIKLLESLRTKKPLLATGGVDFHRLEHFGSPLITIKSEQFSKEGIMEKLKAGDFSFGTTGNVFRATDTIQLSIMQKIDSFMSIIVIRLGKSTNKILASFGISLPKWLKELVRTKI